MTTTKLSYSEFKTRKENFKATRPAYLRDLESDNDSATKFAYKMYLNGRIPSYAKN